MIVTAKSGLRGVLVNAITGERIPFAFWADTETGHWRAWAATPDGRQVASPRREVSGRCPLFFVASRAPALKGPDGCGSRGEGAELRRRLLGRTLAIPGRYCERPGCDRLAEFKTADEMLLAPERDAEGVLHERAMTVAVHRWCAWHYRLPRVIAPNGDTVREVEVLAMPGR